MNLFQLLWEAFSFETRSVEELVELSAKIDAEKSNNGFLLKENDELSQIACTVVALMNEKSTSDVGKKLYYQINDLLVNKNLSFANENNGPAVYEQTKAKDVPGTFKIRITHTGCKFDLVSSTGEVLATSEVYASMDSCLNGIASVKKNAKSTVENQTGSGWESVNNPKFQIYQDSVGKYRFILKARNGEILMASGGHETPEKCVSAIERMKVSAATNDIEKN